MEGLLRLLSVCLRVLCLLEYEVRRALAGAESEAGKKLKGLYAGQGGRATKRPTSEKLLQAMRGVSLVICRSGGEELSYLTPLTELQSQIVKLSGMSAEVYVVL